MSEVRRLLLCLFVFASLFFLPGNLFGASEPFSPDENTVLLWHLDGDVSDSSDKGNKGIQRGGEYVDGKFGKGLIWRRGEKGRVLAHHSESFNIEDAVTIEAWVHVDAPPEDKKEAQTIIFKHQCFSLAIRGDRFEGSVWVDGWWRSVTCPAVFDKWTHVAMTYDSSTREIGLYVNGVLGERTVLKALSTYKIHIFNRPFILWSWHGNQSLLSGIIDEVRVSNIARSFEKTFVPPAVMSVGQSDWYKTFANRGWIYTYESMTNINKWITGLRKYDILIFGTIYNEKLKADLTKSVYTNAFKEFLNRGGVIVVLDANYDSQLSWIGVMDPKLDLKWELCSHYTKGKTKDSEIVKPAHEIFQKPYRLKTRPFREGYWAHFKEYNKDEWQVLIRCQDGNPYMVRKRFGEGFLLVSNLNETLQYETGPFIVNIWYYVRDLYGASEPQVELVQKEGDVLEVEEKYSVSLHGGKNYLTLSLGNKTEKRMMLETKCSVYNYQTGEGLNATGKFADIEPASRIEHLTHFWLVDPGMNKVIITVKDRKGKERLYYQHVFYKGLEDIEIVPGRRYVCDLDGKMEVRIQTKDERFITGKDYRMDMDVLDNEYKFLKNIDKTLTFPGNGVIKTRVDIPDLKVGENHIRVALKKKNKLLNHYYYILIKLDKQRPYVWVDENNNITLDGKPFFPIGIYHPSLQDLEVMKDAHFNLSFFMWYRITREKEKEEFWAYMKRAEELGIKLVMEELLSLADDENYRGYFDHYIRSRIGIEPARKYEYPAATLIKHFVDNKQIIFWDGVDEPSGKKYSRERLYDNMDPIRLIDGNHFIYITDHIRDNYKYYIKGCDVFNIEAYEKLAGENVAQIEPAMQDSFGYQPVVATLRYTAHERKEPRPYDYLRACAYLSIIHGAKGIAYYSIWCADKNERLVYKRYPESWARVKELNKELVEMSSVFLSGTVKTDMIQITPRDKIHYIVKRKGEDYFLLSVNVSIDEKPVEAQILINSKEPLKLEELYAAKPLRKGIRGKEKLALTYCMNDVRIFEFSKK